MKLSHKATIGSGCIAIACIFIQPWEGLWTTAKVDTIGTGHPVTVCNGATKAEIPNLKVGQKFTKQECTDLLLKSLPKYWNGIAPCIHVQLPDDTKAALISAAYNAGPAAVCRSPMVARMNANDIFGGCDSFDGWYIRASGRVVKGLINRRNGEKKLCLEGATEKPTKPPKVSFWMKLIAFLKG
jgi:lysozyme